MFRLFLALVGSLSVVEPTYSINRVDLTQGSFTTHLAGSRATWTPTSLMFMSALVPYNSSTREVSTNVRLRWEYRPGSELFVVYNEERDTGARRFPDLSNRAFVVKVNRLMRFWLRYRKRKPLEWDAIRKGETCLKASRRSRARDGVGH